MPGYQVPPHTQAHPQQGYPQQPYPHASYPQQPYPQQPYGGAGYAPPARKKGGKGCLVAVVVFLALVGGVVVAAGYGLKQVGERAGAAIGSVSPCPYVSTADATEAIGTPAEATLFTGGVGRLVNITDSRVLADQDSCVLQPSGSDASGNGMPGLGRTVKFVGADTTTRFQGELRAAKGAKEERGNGLTVERESYFNKAVPNLGDEAFCTKSTMTLAGVLVRKGQTLVYVALVQKSDGGPGVDLRDPDNVKLGTDDAACVAAQVLARKILALPLS